MADKDESTSDAVTIDTNPEKFRMRSEFRQTHPCVTKVVTISNLFVECLKALILSCTVCYY